MKRKGRLEKAGKDGRRYRDDRYLENTSNFIGENHPILYDYRKYLENLQPSTQARYIKEAGLFLDFCIDETGTDDLTEIFGYEEKRGVKIRKIDAIKVRDYLNTPRQGSLEEVSNRTYQNRRNYLKRFFQFLMEMGYIDTDLCNNRTVSFRSGDDSEGREPLDKFEVAILRENARYPERLSCSVRNKKTLKEFSPMWSLFIDICLATGARFSEVANMTWRDIDETNRRFRFTQKGNKPRKNIIPDEIMQELEEYKPIQQELFQMVQDRIASGRYRRYKGQEGLPEDLLFFSNKGTRLSNDYTNNTLAVLSEGIEKPVTCHILRHTCASTLMDLTNNINIVKQTLGHKNVATTSLYIHSDDEAMESAVSGMSSIFFSRKEAAQDGLNENQKW